MVDYTHGFWDYDGTLGDNEILHNLAIEKKVLEQYKMNLRTMNWWDFCSGTGHAFIWETLESRSQRFHTNKDAFIRMCLKEYEDNIDQLKPREGTINALGRYVDAGMKNIVISATMGGTLRKSLEVAGQDRFIEEAYGPDDLDKLGIERKPSPLAAIKIAKRHNVKSMDHVVGHEDSEKGCKFFYDAHILTAQFIHHAGFGEDQPHKKSPYAQFHLRTKEDLDEFIDRVVEGDLEGFEELSKRGFEIV